MEGLMMNELQERIAAIQSDIENKNEYPKAISKLEQILIKDPNNADAYYLIGLAYQREKKYDSAINYLIKSLIINPQNSVCDIRLKYCTQMCSVLLGTGKFVQYFDMVPNSISFFWFRGLLLYFMGQYRNAIKEYSKAVEHSPQDEELYYEIAKCYNKNGECDKAVAEYENYLKIDTKNEASNIYIEIAFMFIENNRFNDALLFFNKFVNIACDNSEKHMRLLSSSFYLQDFREHVQICTDAFKSVPENWSAFSCGLILELIAMNSKIE